MPSTPPAGLVAPAPDPPHVWIQSPAAEMPAFLPRETTVTKVTVAADPVAAVALIASYKVCPAVAPTIVAGKPTLTLLHWAAPSQFMSMGGRPGEATTIRADALVAMAVSTILKYEHVVCPAPYDVSLKTRAAWPTRFGSVAVARSTHPSPR